MEVPEFQATNQAPAPQIEAVGRLDVEGILADRESEEN